MYSKKTTFRALSVAENKNFNNLVIIEEQIGFQSIFFKSVFKYFMNKYFSSVKKIAIYQKELNGIK